MKERLIKFVMIIFLVLSSSIFAQKGDIGFGLQFGDPTGGTLKYFTNRTNAFNFTLGSSYFGALRFGVDYLWHFNAFKSEIVKMHAGFGGVLGLGDSKSVIFTHEGHKFYDRGGKAGIGIRGLIGIDVYPRNSPFEIFLELGPLVGLTPETGSAIDVGLGFRFYPD